MSISQELKQKLAKAARDLADEIEAGKGPELGFGQLFNDEGGPCCVMGHVYTRAGILSREDLLYEEIRTVVYVGYPVEAANDAKAPWADHRFPGTPLPVALRDYAFAVEGL